MTSTVKSLFPRSSFVGFDHLFDQLDYIAKHSNDSYPPHNILKTGETHYLIELALAGFNEDEITVEVDDRTLTVSGDHVSKGREYIHRGISTKRFKRNFRLSEYVQVNGAEFKDGILAIHLEYVVPESMRPRKIAINKFDEDSNDTHTKQLLQEDQEYL